MIAKLSQATSIQKLIIAKAAKENMFPYKVENFGVV